jgi:hypothetical protein
MPQKLANDGQSHARARACRRVGMTKIMDADTRQARRVAYGFPGPLQIKAPPVPSGDDIRATCKPGQSGEDRQRGRGQTHRLPASLAIGQSCKPSFEVDVDPPQGQNLAEPHPGERQEPYGGDRMWPEPRLVLAQRITEAS